VAALLFVRNDDMLAWRRSEQIIKESRVSGDFV
jgi:hypothetical protein